MEELGQAAYALRDYDLALRIFKTCMTATTDGADEARCMVGQMHWRGQGVRVNTLVALTLFCQAAQTSSSAVLSLADMFVSADAERAFWPRERREEREEGEGEERDACPFDLVASAHACFDHLIAHPDGEAALAARVMQLVLRGDILTRDITPANLPLILDIIEQLRHGEGEEDLPGHWKARALFAANTFAADIDLAIPATERTDIPTSDLHFWCLSARKAHCSAIPVDLITNMRTICTEENLVPFPCGALARTLPEVEAALTGARCFCFRRAPLDPSLRPFITPLPERALAIHAIRILTQQRGDAAIPFLVRK